MTIWPFVYILSLLFCGWQLIVAAAQADLHDSFDSRRWSHRRMVRRDMTSGWLAMAMGLLFAVGSGWMLLESGARLSAVLGPALLIGGITLVVRLFFRVRGRSHQERLDPWASLRSATRGIVEAAFEIVFESVLGW